MNGLFPMNRSQKLKLNTVLGLISQIVTFICGFIIPRIILVYYGSEVNGLVLSINHFLSFISLAECGIGVVIQSSLYKPLATGDTDEVSRIIVSSDRFFRNIGIILFVYVLVLAVVYPSFISSSFSKYYVVSLILVLSISTFIQHYVCMSYRLLVSADQAIYVLLSLQILTQILTTIVCVLLARMGATIQLFKLSSSIILFLQPIILVVYVKRNYSINKRITYSEEPIKQKWNGLAQHIAYVVLNNTDTVVLTLFSSLISVSIYNVYYLVVSGIRTLITSSVTGMQSLLGNMYANNEDDKLNSTFSKYEWAMHFGVTFLFACTSVLIVPFVRVYTLGINDANYEAPLFGILLSLAQMVYCLRIPYNSMVFAAGHYKQTQNSAIIEACINIVLSICLVIKFGLVGVAIGTLTAMSYRTVYLAMYLRKNIINRPIHHFIKHVIIDAIVISLSIVLANNIELPVLSYSSWLVISIKTALIVAVIVFIPNFVFYPWLKDYLYSFIKMQK